MLDQLDDDLDDAGEKMNFVMAKLGKLLKTKSNAMCTCRPNLEFLICC